MPRRSGMGNSGTSRARKDRVMQKRWMPLTSMMGTDSRPGVADATHRGRTADGPERCAGMSEVVVRCHHSPRWFDFKGHAVLEMGDDEGEMWLLGCLTCGVWRWVPALSAGSWPDSPWHGGVVRSGVRG